MRYWLCLLIISFLSCRQKKPADLIIHNARVYTVDSHFSIVESFAIKEGKVIALGTGQEILAGYDAPETIGAEGRFVYPGFIDGHAHFFGYASGLNNVDLSGSKSWEECIERVSAFLEKRKSDPGEWILGRGWDQNDWEGKSFPDSRKLDSLFPNNPVYLTRVDGHAAIASQSALAAAEVKTGEKVIGGLFEVKNNRLTGILIDNAMGRVAGMIPATEMDFLEESFLEAQKNCFAVGLTGITECGLSKQRTDWLDSLQKANKLKMKLTVMLSEDPADYLPNTIYKTDRMHIAGFKIMGDGALGSRGACLLHPYSDQAGWTGFLLGTEAYYRNALARIFDSPFQACTHAIGDSANRLVLDISAMLMKEKNDRRWRIEHAQVVAPEDFKKFGLYSIIPSVQSTHATSDMYWAEQRLGPTRVKGAYAFKDLLKENGWLVLGTDFPVEDISPFKTFYASIARKDGDGFPDKGFQMENALSREETLRGMTIWAAKGTFEEQEKGSLEQGKWADFIITDTDIMNCPAEAILQTKVLATYINGEKVYGK